VWGSGRIDPVLLISAVVRFKIRPLYTRKKSPGTHRIGGWVGLKTGLHDVERRKICPYRDSNYNPSAVQARSQSLSSIIGRKRQTGFIFFSEFVQVADSCVHGDEPAPSKEIV
jgi:hypothetical protein